jgi:single-strand DNA-binding protein
MPATNINRVCVSGNLTADPDLRETSTGHSVCEMRMACNVPVKKDGNWESKANYFQVNAWGGMGENCAKYLEKGSPIMVDGRLEWQMWKKDDQTNSRIVIVAENIQFGRKADGKSPTSEKAETAIPDDEDIGF